MNKRHVKQLIALSCAASLSITGCGAIVSEDVQSYPLESTLTQQEVVDYYAKALDYDSIVSRNVTVHQTNYVKKDISGEKAEKLKALTNQAEAILGKNEYEVTEDNLKIVSNDTFNYIKGVIDNEVLTNSQILNIQGALGYYFVDVQYDISAKKEGSFNQLTSLVGLDGAFIKNYDDSYTVDTAYLKQVAEKMNEYFYDNSIISCANYDEGTGVFSVAEGIAPIVKTTTSDVSGQLSINGVSSLDGSTQELENTDASIETGTNTSEIMNLPGDEETQTEVSSDEAVDESTGTDDTLLDSENIDSTSEGVADTTNNVYATDSLNNGTAFNSIVSSNRKIQFDNSLINSVVGSSLRQSATLPDLKYVYNIPDAEGVMSGYGIYIAGGNGLKVFGFDRNALAGQITLRYVFKDDVKGTGDILGVNIYPVEENITNGINVASNNVLIPEFLMTELEKVIERADRVQVDCDLSGMMSGHLYEDMGFGVLRGYRNKNTGIERTMSTIRQVINRDTANNSYLLEIESVVTEGARDVDCYGTYKDKSYVVVQQQGDEFIIVDQLRVSREVYSEPSINPDSAVEKRLVALNLAGEIPDESKDEITSLMSELYTAGTNRVLRGPKDITVKGETVTIEKGMYDCFQNDVTMMSTDELEYANSKLRNVLVKHGSDISSIYSGTITEWIGGYENQAEFTTEELVTYQGMPDAYYMQVYYLVSKMNDTWVIDERTVIDEEEITDSGEISNIKARVGQE